MSFHSFKNSRPAREVFTGLQLANYLEQAESWELLRIMIVAFNGCDEGNFVKRARNYDRVCSSGEGILLRAILYVTDFAWLADELDEGRTWQRLGDLSGSYRQAVAACISTELVW
ncbi:hypothetical protein [Rhodoblastus sp.]|jgi:hypothetical protein|uniref:hypothetical protein n=1 Tax=Rhodoblastus sp. TaxID=1962975 RepID=UPI0025DBBACC|nr:hypothetical protein [Rhodoblastus sp.]